jgi:ethanolamine utilization protein EutQ
VVIGNPGDIIYIPKGSDIFFGSPSYAKVFYVTFPADWELQK